MIPIAMGMRDVVTEVAVAVAVAVGADASVGLTRTVTARTPTVRTAKAGPHVVGVGVVVAGLTARMDHRMIRPTRSCAFANRAGVMRSPASRDPRDSKPRSSVDAKAARPDVVAHPS